MTLGRQSAAPEVTPGIGATADLVGVLFQHVRDDPKPDLHTHCLVLGATRARVARTWRRLHRSTFADRIPFGAMIYQKLLAKALRRRLDV